MALTRRQKEVMDFIVGFIRENEYSPSYDEIANGLNLASLATVHKHIGSLETKGYLVRRYNHSRSLEVTRLYFDTAGPTPEPADLTVPLVGRIAAGLPVEAFAQEESLHFKDFVEGENTYALEVRGDSMIDDHILSGDYVLVQSTPVASDGQIVVALVEGAETTLKRFYREPGGKARLQPANSSMEPIIVPLDQVQIRGRVLAVLRKYD